MSSRDEPSRVEKQAHRYAEYEAQDQKGEPIGQVDDLFVDHVNGQEYVELNMGVLGLRSTVVPLEICTIDEERKTVFIAQSRTKLRRAPRKRAPLLGDEVMAITPEYEDRIRAYFGLEPTGAPTEERPFRAFSTAYPTGSESPRGEIRSVEARVLDRTPVEPGTAGPQDGNETAATEPVSAESVPADPQGTEPDVVEVQDAESVEPEIVGPQDAEAAEPEAAEPEAIDLAAAEDEAVAVTVAEPDSAEEDAAPRAEEETPLPAGEPELEEAGSSKGVVSDGDETAEAPAEDAPSDEAAGVQEPESASDSDEQSVRPDESEVPGEAAAARADKVETAGQEMSEAARQSLQAIADRAVTVQESNLDLSRSLAQTFVEQVQGQTQGNRQAAQMLQEQGQRQQQALQTIIQGSVNAYANLFTSTFSLYQQALQSATRVTLSNLQAANRIGQRGMTASTSGAQRAAEAAGQSMEAVGQSAQQSAEEVGRDPSQGGAKAQQPEQPNDTGQTAQGDAQETVGQDTDAVERTAREGNAELTGGSTGRDAGPVGETSVGSGAQAAGGDAFEIDEAAPAGGAGSELLLPPPPVAPNILDELPPAPQAPSVDETMSEDERPEGRR